MESEKKVFQDEYYKNFSQLADVSNKITDTVSKLISTIINYDLLCSNIITAAEINNLTTIIFIEKAQPYISNPEQEKVDQDVEDLYSRMLLNMEPFTKVVKKLSIDVSIFPFQ